MSSLAGSGQIIAIVTNNPRVVSHEFAARHQWLVNCIIGFYDVHCSKPNPDGMLLALSQRGGEAEGSYHVGDRPQGTAAARAAEITPIGAGWGSLELEQLRRSLPESLFMSVTALRRFLLGQCSEVDGSHAVPLIRSTDDGPDTVNKIVIALAVLSRMLPPNYPV